MNLPPFISVREAALWVGSRTVLYELLGQGKVTAIKVGARTLVNVESLQRFLSDAPQAEIRVRRRSHAAS